MEIKIYTDGACAGNPGPGGWAAIVLLENEKKELFGGEKLTTNNRMELTAAIKALEYCANNQEEKQPSLKNVKNVDLWKKLKELIQSNQVEWNWIKGRSEDAMNNLADKLAKKATPI